MEMTEIRWAVSSDLNADRVCDDVTSSGSTPVLAATTGNARSLSTSEILLCYRQGHKKFVSDKKRTKLQNLAFWMKNLQLPTAGFEPWYSHTAVRHVTARPLRPETGTQ